MALMTASAAHKARLTDPGRTRVSNQMATPSNTTPKTALTAFIQAPARGRKWPAEVPMISKGTPIPRLKAKSDNPPRKTSPVWEMKSSPPARGAATQGPTISAESIPMTKVLIRCPPRPMPARRV